MVSKILKPNETGFGIMIESDSGYISSEINKNVINENFELKPNEPVLVNCILQKWGVKNKNGRIYPKDVLIPQVKAYQELIDNNNAISEVDHPEQSVISLKNVSHLITKIWWGSGEQENVLFGQLRIIVSPGFIKYGVCSMIGDNIIVLLQSKVKIGISSRGVGTLKEINGENIVQSDFELIGFDLVATPSTPGAYLYPVTNNNGDKFNEQITNNNNNSLIESNSKTINDAINKFLL